MSNLYAYANGQPHSYENILKASDDIAELGTSGEEMFESFLAINHYFVIKFVKKGDGYVSVATYGRIQENTR